MTSRDPAIASLLERVVPRLEDNSDWNRVLRDAGEERNVRRIVAVGRVPRRRLVVVAAAVCLAVLIAVPAVGVSRDLWFISLVEPTPVGEVVLITTGDVAGQSWYLTGFVSEEHGVCAAVALDRDVGAGTMSCGMPIRGAPRPAGDDEPPHWVGTASATWPSSEGIRYVYGATASEVAQVDIEVTDSAPVAARTLEAPGLGAPVRFYVVFIPLESKVTAVIARSSEGAVLERFPIPPTG